MSFIQRLFAFFGIGQKTEVAIADLGKEARAALAEAKASVEHLEEVAVAHAQSAENVIKHYSDQIRREVEHNKEVQTLAADIKAEFAHLFGTTPPPPAPPAAPAPSGA